MIKKLFILLFLIYIYNFCFSYKAITGEVDSNNSHILNLDDEGNISIEETITLSTTAEIVAVSLNGKFAFSRSRPLHKYIIDKAQNVTYIGDFDPGTSGFITISTDLKYIIFKGWPDWPQGSPGIYLYKINDGLTLSPTGNFIPTNENLHPLEFQESKNSNIILANNYEYKEVAIFRRIEDQIFDTCQRISIAPYVGNLDLVITPNGRFCYIAGNEYVNGENGTVCCEILPNGNVIYKGCVTTEGVSSMNKVTSDSRYLLTLGGAVHSFRIEDNGNLTLIYTSSKMENIQGLAITPDNKYVYVAWNHNLQGQIISIFRLYPDGTLEKLDKDKLFPQIFTDTQFIPPYVTSTDDEIWEMYE